MREIKINQKQLEKWWKELNTWHFPKDFRKPLTGNERQAIRGAFSVIDYFITWKYPKFIVRKH